MIYQYWPQLLMISWWGCLILTALLRHNEKPKDVVISREACFFSTCIRVALGGFVLWCGGFFEGLF